MRAHILGGWLVSMVVVVALTAGASAAVAATGHGLVGNSATLQVVTLAGAAISKNITVGKIPEGVVYDPATQKIYIANDGASTVSVISGTTNTVSKTITVGLHPDVITYDPTNSELYVFNSGSSTLSLIGTANTVVATVTIHGSVFGAPVYDPANGDMYLDSGTYSIHGAFFNLSKIDHATNAVTTIAVGAGPNNIVYDNATTEMIATDAGANSISRVNSTTNTVTTIHLTKGTLPFEEVYNAVTRNVEIVDEGAQTKGATGNLSVYGPTHKIVSTVKLGSFSTFATVDPATGTVFVTNSGISNMTTGKYPPATISVVSSANKLKATVTVGRQAFLTSYSPASADLYIPCAQSNTTYVLNAVTFALVGSPLATHEYPVIAFYLPSHQEMLVIGNSNSTGIATTTTVTVLSSTNTIVGTLVLPKGAAGGGAYDPSNQDGYVSNEKADSVTVIH